MTSIHHYYFFLIYTVFLHFGSKRSSSWWHPEILDAEFWTPEFGFRHIWAGLCKVWCSQNSAKIWIFLVLKEKCLQHRSILKYPIFSTVNALLTKVMSTRKTWIWPKCGHIWPDRWWPRTVRCYFGTVSLEVHRTSLGLACLIPLQWCFLFPLIPIGLLMTLLWYFTCIHSRERSKNLANES